MVEVKNDLRAYHMDEWIQLAGSTCQGSDNVTNSPLIAGVVTHDFLSMYLYSSRCLHAKHGGNNSRSPMVTPSQAAAADLVGCMNPGRM